MHANWYLKRLTNLIRLSNLSKDTIWTSLRKLKLKNEKCSGKKNTDEILSHVKAVEQALQTESTDQRYENITSEQLQCAAKMFIFLNTCPDSWFNRWNIWYMYFFTTQPADQIILTLNRMMKTKTSQDKGDSYRAEKLLKRAARLLSLSFQEIQSLKPENEVTNRSAKDIHISDGMHFIRSIVCKSRLQLLTLEMTLSFYH